MTSGGKGLCVGVGMGVGRKAEVNCQVFQQYAELLTFGPVVGSMIQRLRVSTSDFSKFICLRIWTSSCVFRNSHCTSNENEAQLKFVEHKILEPLSPLQHLHVELEEYILISVGLGPQHQSEKDAFFKKN